MTRPIALPLALIAGLALAACNPSTPTPEREPAPSPTTEVAAKGAGEAQPGDDVMDGCPGGAKADHGTCGAEAANGKDGLFGSPLSKTSAEPLATVAGRLGEAAETVQVSGTVDSVCQKAGCWMVLKDGETTARIFTKGHGFFLPKDIAGQKALVEGEIKAKTISEKFAKHLEQDNGGDPDKVKGDQRELVMDATTVKLVPNS
jgi:hypothetical protein